MFKFINRCLDLLERIATSLEALTQIFGEAAKQEEEEEKNQEYNGHDWGKRWE